MHAILLPLLLALSVCVAISVAQPPPAPGACYVSPSGVVFPDSEQLCNNVANPQWGSSGHTMLRTNLQGTSPVSKNGAAEYADGIGEMLVREKPGFTSVRDISNALDQQCDCHNIYSTSQIRTDSFVYFGQFLNHDMNLIPANGKNPNTPGHLEVPNIPVPPNDPFFTDYTTVIPFSRSDVLAGTGATTQRMHANSRTSYVDLSDVYGVSTAVTNLLRSHSGGKLLMDNTTKLLPRMMAAGDPRINENFGLIAFQTLFAINHNYWAARFQQQSPTASDEELFHLARQRNVAEFQTITFNQYLPLLLGDIYSTAYPGYSDSVDASSNQEMLVAAFRFGHSTVSPLFLRRTVDNDAAGGDILLRDTYFQPDRYTATGGTESLLYGMMYQRMQQVDLSVIDGLRVFLFGPGDPSLGMDLIAINIQRGRDNGILSFNNARRAYSLKPYSSFSDLVDGNSALANALSSVYASVEDCDLFICGLAEVPLVSNGVVGQTFAVILEDQFSRLRQGDRFYFENQCQNGALSPSDCAAIRSFRLQDLLTRHLSKPVTWNPFLIRSETVDGLCTSNSLVQENFLAANTAASAQNNATAVLLVMLALMAMAMVVVA